MEFGILIFGILITVAGILLYRKSIYLINYGEKTEAIIYRFEKKSGADYSALYYPVVRFKTKEMIWITQELNVGSNPPLYEEGEKIEIIYDPKNPTNLDVYPIAENQKYFLLMIGVGLILLTVIGLKIFEII